MIGKFLIGINQLLSFWTCQQVHDDDRHDDDEDEEQDVGQPRKVQQLFVLVKQRRILDLSNHHDDCLHD